MSLVGEVERRIGFRPRHLPGTRPPAHASTGCPSCALLRHCAPLHRSGPAVHSTSGSHIQREAAGEPDHILAPGIPTRYRASKSNAPSVYLRPHVLLERESAEAWKRLMLATISGRNEPPPPRSVDRTLRERRIARSVRRYTDRPGYPRPAEPAFPSERLQHQHVRRKSLQHLSCVVSPKIAMRVPAGACCR